MTKSQRKIAWYVLTSLSVVFGLLCGIAIFNGGGSGFILFFILSAIPLGVRAVIDQSEKTEERAEEMQNLASQLGFHYQEKAPINVLGWSDSFQLTKFGSVFSKELEKSKLADWLPWLIPRSRNVLKRTIEDMELAVFDCPVVEGKTQKWKSVIVIQSPELDIPHLGLYPKSGLDKLASMLQSHVSVHGKYRLVTSDASTFEMINKQLLDWLKGTWSLEVGDGFLLLYQDKQLSSIDVIETMIRTALEIHNLFAERPDVQSTSSIPVAATQPAIAPIDQPVG